MGTSIVGCDLDGDNSFGPVIAGCREEFDFTLLFEQTVLSTIPAVFAIIAAVASIFRLSRQNVKTAQGQSWRPRLAISLVRLHGRQFNIRMHSTDISLYRLHFYAFPLPI